MEILLTKTPHSFSSNTYIISSEGECAIVDPSTPYDSSLFSGIMKYILLTHAHFDHMLDIDSWVSATGAQVIISVEEQEALADPVRNCYKLYDGSDRGYFGDSVALNNHDKLKLGDSDIELIFTPGHTKGSVVYLVDSSCFVGDTVFAGGGYGRFDLPTGDGTMLSKSIELIMNLPEDTMLYPGHGPATTVKEFIFDFNR